MSDILTPEQRASASRQAERASCGDAGPTLHGAPEGWFEAACAAVAAEQARMRAMNHQGEA